jgi:hypothetical protein
MLDHIDDVGQSVPSVAADGQTLSVGVDRLPSASTPLYQSGSVPDPVKRSRAVSRAKHGDCVKEQGGGLCPSRRERRRLSKGHRRARRAAMRRRLRPRVGAGYLDVLTQYPVPGLSLVPQAIERCSHGYAPSHLPSANFWSVEAHATTGDMRARPLVCGDVVHCPRCSGGRGRSQAAKASAIFDGIYDGAQALGLPLTHRMSGVWFTIPKTDSAAVHALSDPPDGYHDADLGERQRDALERRFEQRRKRYRRVVGKMCSAAQRAVVGILPSGVEPGGVTIVHTHGTEDPLTPHYHFIVLVASVAFDREADCFRAISHWRSTEDREQLRSAWTDSVDGLIRREFGRGVSADGLLNVRVGFHRSQAQARHTLNYELRPPLRDLMQGLTGPGVYEWQDKAGKLHERTLDVGDVAQFVSEFKARRHRLCRFRQWGFLAPNVKGKRLPALGFVRVEDTDDVDIEWVSLGTFALNGFDEVRGVAIMRCRGQTIELPVSALLDADPVGMSAGHGIWQRLRGG